MSYCFVFREFGVDFPGCVRRTLFSVSNYFCQASLTFWRRKNWKIYLLCYLPNYVRWINFCYSGMELEAGCFLLSEKTLSENLGSERQEGKYPPSAQVLGSREIGGSVEPKMGVKSYSSRLQRWLRRKSSCLECQKPWV